MNNYILLIPIVIIAIIIITMTIYLIKKSKNKDETTASILDVNEVGVPSSSDFTYGYEKEETVIMNPIKEDEENESEEEFPDISDADEIDITTTMKSFKKDEE